MTTEINRELIAQYRSIVADTPMLAVADAFVPEPTTADYEFGEIRRYFAQQANQRFGEITEVSKGLYNELKSKSLYTVVEIRWKISGPAEDLINEETGEVATRGIRTANRASREQAAKTMPAITQRLTNLFQLWRGY